MIRGVWPRSAVERGEVVPCSAGDALPDGVHGETATRVAVERALANR